MPKLKTKKRPPSQPVWDGPEAEGPRGGVTQGMISRWLCCRERFRLRVIEGLSPADTFNHRIEYGSMWHVCEESHAQGKPCGDTLREYAQQLCRRYPLQQEQVQHWYNVCRTQFPLYVQYWAEHPDVKERTPLLQEQVFDVSYDLPSGRTVRLRGRWDSVDLVGRGKSAGVYLQENKSKGDIVEEQLKRQLGFDLQTMLYLVALYDSLKDTLVNSAFTIPNVFSKNGGRLQVAPAMKVQGVRYNVVRRPLSGGKGSIRKHQPTKSNPAGESDEEFYDRLGQVIMEDPPYYFMRWRIEVTPGDLQRFRHEFLDGALEEMCRWWDWVSSPEGREDPFADPIHFRLPFGIYNVLAEGGSSEVDEYLASKSELGLVRSVPLFTELG